MLKISYNAKSETFYFDSSVSKSCANIVERNEWSIPAASKVSHSVQGLLDLSNRERYQWDILSCPCIWKCFLDATLLLNLELFQVLWLK